MTERSLLLHMTTAVIIVTLVFVHSVAFGEDAQLTYVPIGSQAEKSLHLIFPDKFRKTAYGMRSKIDDEFRALTEVLDADEGFQAQIRLMEAASFYERMQVPTWTNAIYLNSRIIIPVDTGSTGDTAELQRAIRHELVHAIVDHQTSGSCPGWLDEGLAQLLEGPEHPVLRQALRKWVLEEGAIPFDLLQNGFTKLPRAMVPAAYAQSLYTTKFLLSHQTPETLRAFFDDLRNNVPFSIAFEERFDISFERFEELLALQLKRLALEVDEREVSKIWGLTYQDLRERNTGYGQQKASISAQAVTWGEK